MLLSNRSPTLSLSIGSWTEKMMLCKSNLKSSRRAKKSILPWSQVSFQENKATLQGADIFMASFELCTMTTAESQVDNNLHGLNSSVEMATSVAYLMLHGAGCMCEKQFENTSWRLRDCAESIKTLYKYVCCLFSSFHCFALCCAWNAAHHLCSCSPLEPRARASVMNVCGFTE